MAAQSQFEVKAWVCINIVGSVQLGSINAHCFYCNILSKFMHCCNDFRRSTASHVSAAEHLQFQLLTLKQRHAVVRARQLSLQLPHLVTQVQAQRLCLLLGSCGSVQSGL